MFSMMKCWAASVKQNLLSISALPATSGRAVIPGTLFTALACLTLLSLMHVPAAKAQEDAALLESLRACQDVSQMSARLACYDQLLPPAATAGAGDNTAPLTAAPPAADNPGRALSEERRSPRPARPEPGTVQIVAVERPEFRTFRLTTADGQVYVHSNAVRIPQWPDTPFEAEIQTSIFGNSTYLNIPAIRTRIRVVHESSN